MKHNTQNISSHHCGVQPDEPTVCDDCSRVGAYRLGDHVLCLDCYSNRGSCCPEFGQDDLWTFSDEAGSPRAGAT
jgi:hypothetical protein